MAKTYQIALTNVDFDNSYNNSIRFNNRAEQEQYFDIANLSFSPYVNFNFGSLLETKVTYKDTSLSAVDLLNKNYAIVKETIDGVTKYYYYFIRNSKFDTLSQIILDIELDVIQTYYIDLTFQDCLIERAHLNRFIYDDVNSSVKFDGSINSKLFERENISLSKRLISREKINIKTINGDEEGTINKWIKDNVICWIYIFYNTETGIKFLNKDNTEVSKNKPFFIAHGAGSPLQNFKYRCPYQVICCPVYSNTSNQIKIKTGDTYITIVSNFDDFIALNNEANIYGIKFSLIPPFLRNYSAYYPSIEDGDLIITGGYDDDDILIFGLYSGAIKTNSNGNGNIIFMRSLTIDKWQTASFTHTLPYDFSFEKSEIIGANKNKKYNPKLLNSDFTDLKLTNNINSFSYDMQKLNLKSFNLIYNENLSPDITNGYLRILTDDDNIYNSQCMENFTGLVFKADNGLLYGISQLQTFLANNKNFYLQRDIGMVNDIFKTVVNLNRGLSNSAMQFAGGNFVGGGVSANEAIAGTITNTADIIVNRINSNLTLDNMKNAPETIKNADGNILFNISCTDFGLYVEIYSALENELEIANDYMHRYGFTYNQIDNIKNVDNIRVYFNYIKADVENITGINLSNTIKNKIREIFRNGIRLWNNTSEIFKYDKENYERWLTL